EDGIRDPLVTGVQTCALPICCPAAVNKGFTSATLKRLARLNISTIKSIPMRSPKLMRRATRRSLKTVQGLRPPLRGKLPSRASKLGDPPAAKTAKHGSWKDPVGENLDAMVGPQGVAGAPAGTTFGRPVLGENWKLSGLPVMMLNGRPEANSISGATVQLLNKRRAKPSPESFPV